jgi:hypothetical protein
VTSAGHVSRPTRTCSTGSRGAKHGSASRSSPRGRRSRSSASRSRSDAYGAYKDMVGDSGAKLDCRRIRRLHQEHERSRSLHRDLAVARPRYGPVKEVPLGGWACRARRHGRRPTSDLAQRASSSRAAAWRAPHRSQPRPHRGMGGMYYLALSVGPQRPAALLRRHDDSCPDLFR